MKTISIIGPRLKKDGPIGGWEKNNPIQKEIKKIINDVIASHSTECILVSSLQSGPETWAVEAAIANKMLFEIRLPFESQEAIMPEWAQLTYYSYLDRAHSVVTLSTGGFDIEKMNEKDRSLVSCDTVYSFYPVMYKSIKAMIPNSTELVEFKDLFNPFKSSTKGECNESIEL